MMTDGWLERSCRQLSLFLLLFCPFTKKNKLMCCYQRSYILSTLSFIHMAQDLKTLLSRDDDINNMWSRGKIKIIHLSQENNSCHPLIVTYIGIFLLWTLFFSVPKSRNPKKIKNYLLIFHLFDLQLCCMSPIRSNLMKTPGTST